MSLLDLPTDLLSSIVAPLSTQEFENLALSCHSAYRLLTPFLERHNAYRRSWRKVAFQASLLPARDEIWRGKRSAASHTRELKTIPDLLLQIARDRGIASCVKHLDLTGRLSRESPRDTIDLETNSPDDPETIALVTELVESSPHLKILEASSSYWLNQLLHDAPPDDDIPDCSSIFLLSLLPNLQSLSLPSIWDVITATGPSPASELLHLLIVQANDDRLPSPQPLRSLAHLSRSQVNDDQFGAPLTGVLPFLALSSLRSAFHTLGSLEHINPHASSGPSAETLAWTRRYRPVGRNLETLTLIDTAISDGTEAEVLLQDMHSLRSLTLEFQMKDDVCTNYGVQPLVDVVVQAAGDVLEVLTLTLGWSFAVYTVWGPLRNLTGLTRLKELEIDTGLFYEWEYGVESDDDEATGAEDGEENANDDDDDDDDDEEEMEDQASDDGESQAAEVDDDDDARSTSHDRDYSFSEDEQDPSATHCPSIPQLLRNSLSTLERLTIHVSAQKRDLICLKRLLRGVCVSASSSPTPSHARTTTQTRCRRLHHLKVSLYRQDHFSGDLSDAADIIEEAESFLAANAPGVMVEVVPYSGGGVW